MGQILFCETKKANSVIMYEFCICTFQCKQRWCSFAFGTGQIVKGEIEICLRIIKLLQDVEVSH